MKPNVQGKSFELFNPLKLQPLCLLKTDQGVLIPEPNQQASAGEGLVHVYLSRVHCNSHVVLGEVMNVILRVTTNQSNQSFKYEEVLR